MDSRLMIAALVSALSAPAAQASVLTEHDFRVTIQMKSRQVQVIVRATDQNAAREIAESRYGKDRVKAVVRIWK